MRMRAYPSPSLCIAMYYAYFTFCITHIYTHTYAHIEVKVTLCKIIAHQRFDALKHVNINATTATVTITTTTDNTAVTLECASAVRSLHKSSHRTEHKQTRIHIRTRIHSFQAYWASAPVNVKPTCYARDMQTESLLYGFVCVPVHVVSSVQCCIWHNDNENVWYVPIYTYVNAVRGIHNTISFTQCYTMCTDSLV